MMNGAKEAPLYRRCRHVGMPRESEAEIVPAWSVLRALGLLRLLFGRSALGVGYETGRRLDRRLIVPCRIMSTVSDLRPFPALSSTGQRLGPGSPARC